MLFYLGLDAVVTWMLVIAGEQGIHFPVEKIRGQQNKKLKKMISIELCNWQ